MSRTAALWLSSSCCCTVSTVVHPPNLHNQAAVLIAFSPLQWRNGKRMLIMKNHWKHRRFLRPCSVNDNQSHTIESLDISSPEQTDSAGNENHQQASLTTNETLKRLKRYGISGVLSYGLLNTAYYLSTFLFVWLYVAPAPGRMGYVAAAQRFLKILAMVWAGSQVTKLIRAGGALALAPAVDRGLSWFTAKYKFKSQGKAFAAIAGFCFGLAFMVFLVLTLLWA